MANRFEVTIGYPRGRLMPRDIVTPTLGRVFGALAILSVLQWLVLAPLIIDVGAFNNLDCWLNGVSSSIENCPKGVTILRIKSSLVRAVPFKSDFFFMFWNVFPILLYLSYLLMETSYSSLRDAIWGRFILRPDTPEPIGETRWRSHWVIVTFSVALERIQFTPVHILLRRNSFGIPQG